MIHSLLSYAESYRIFIKFPNNDEFFSSTERVFLKLWF